MVFSGMDECLRQIFAPVMVGGIDRSDTLKMSEKRDIFRQALPLFKTTFGSNIFSNEYAFLYEILTSLKISVFSESQLETIIENNKDKILLSPYIDINEVIFGEDGSANTSISDDEKLVGFRQFLVAAFRTLSNEVVTIEEFRSASEMFIFNYRENQAQEIAFGMSQIMSPTGKEVKERSKNRVYKGSTDMLTYFTNNSRVLKEYQERDRIKHSVIDEKWLAQELEQTDDSKTGQTITFGIKEIDDIMGHIRRSNMLGILGPAKGGKTRCAVYLAGRFLAAGYNVAVWPLEGDQKEWEAMLVANQIRGSNGVNISSKDILESTYDERIRQLVVASKTIMATDKTRGKLSFINGVAYIEEFIDVLQSHYDNENAFDVIIIDSMVHLLSKKGMTKSERISEGYEQLKNFITNMMAIPAVAVLPAQLKQIVIDTMRKHPDETMDITAGGESAATIRSPDYVVGLFSDKKERNANMMKFYDVAARHNGNFDDFYAHCELGCCWFESRPELNS